MEGDARGGQVIRQFNHLLNEASSRWLKVEELMYLFEHYKECNVPVLQRPLWFSNKKGGVYFMGGEVSYRKDGVEWRKKKDGKTVAESHVRLKMNGSDVVRCYYVHSFDDTLHRRAYNLCGSGDDTTILIYRSFFSPLSPSTPPSLPLPPSSPSSFFFPPSNQATLSLSPHLLPSQSSPFLSLPPQLQIEEPLESEITTEPLMVEQNNNSRVHISEYSPQWDYTEGGAKVLITLHNLHSYLLNSRHSSFSLFCMFGSKQVPCHIVQQDVVRCYAPEHSEGHVGFCLSLGNGAVISDIKTFEYKRHPFSLISCENFDWLNHSTQGELGLRILKRLDVVEQMLRQNNLENQPNSTQSASSEKTLKIGMCRDKKLERILREREELGEGLENERDMELLYVLCILGYVFSINFILLLYPSIPYSSCWISLCLSLQYGRLEVIKLFLDARRIGGERVKLVSKFVAYLVPLLPLSPFKLQLELYLATQFDNQSMYPISYHQIHSAVTTIQAFYRGHVVRKTNKRRNNAARRIQQEWRRRVKEGWYSRD
eukprot:CAMPEP_0174268676 /NCGR_PEP_ID=MMETSP0439-20130205/38271_1 /TAXON_ID=0 /ORGANISM="Stereomyxa ramosa, Strain Chinc5" /LENGTH=541 /DNA_ID=CAMNT_0015356995 /DNA_START=1 /DNA_END=1626 /DNA_ORIENTATION=+